MKKIFLLIPLFQWLQLFADTTNNKNIERLETYCQKHPDQWEGDYNLGREYYFNNDYENAKEHFSKALKNASQEQQEPIFFNLGTTYFQEAQTGNTQEKIQLLEKSIQNYESALSWNQNAHDTQNNLKLAQKQLNDLKKKQQNKKESDDKSESNNKDKDKNEDQNQKQENATNGSAEDKPIGSSQGNKKQEMQNILEKGKNEQKILPIQFSTDDNALSKDQILKDW